MLVKKLEQAVLLDNRGNDEDVIIVCTKADSIGHDGGASELPELRQKLRPAADNLKAAIKKESELRKKVQMLRANIKDLGRKTDAENRATKENLSTELEEARDEL